MSVSVSMTGDFEKLRAFVKRASDVGRAQYLIAKAVRDEALTQVQLGFRAERDPNGQPWAPLKYRTGRILSLTARLRRSFNARVTGSGSGVRVSVGTNVKYAKFHQYGTRTKRGGVKMPARQMLPADGSLGTKWQAPIAAAARAALFRFWGKR